MGRLENYVISFYFFINNFTLLLDKLIFLELDLVAILVKDLDRRVNLRVIQSIIFIIII
jgi:hypothetical protein